MAAAAGTAILGATVQVLLEKALSFATDRIGLVYGFSKDLESLRGSVRMIQAVLAAADEDEQSKRQDLQLWLQSLEEVAYDAYYVLDEFSYEILRSKVKSKNQPSTKVCSFFFFSRDCHSISFRWRMAPKVRDIISKLEAINQQANVFGLHHRMAASLLSTTITGATINRETDSIVSPNVVGRDNDESKIVDMLLSSTERVVSVLPIVGMGGLGKTTLAKLVFNHKRIQDHFSKRIWVCVSDKKFEGTRVFKLILEQLWGKNVQLDSRNAIVQKIQKEVEGKRYLIVLDDIWNENQELWDDFFESLEGLSAMSERSWCLVTCRRLSTATIMATHDQYSLGKLPDNYCWSILKEKAVASGEVPEELIAIKEQVIKQCAGLPLTAKIFGSLLRRQRKEEWRLIMEKKLSDVVEDHEKNDVQILKLSFDYLPSPFIKKCFAYLSIFKKNTEMDKDDLIQLWMAEGFIQQDLKSETTIEKIGDKYLTILLQSSLLEESRNHSGKVVYKLHDLVHDLAKLVSKNETIAKEDGVIDSSCQVRYLALDSFGETIEKMLIDLPTSVRTLFLNHGGGISNEILSKFRRLQVLKLSDKEMVELPSSIGELKHIRYLDLSKPKMKTLPESICKLYNLQTLKIGSSLEVFPKRICKLISLRHLEYLNTNPKFQMPVKMGQLTCIQTLQFFNIGDGMGRGIEELGFLEELQGKLSIRNLELVKCKEGAMRAKLSSKKNLMLLEFHWRSEYRKGIHNYDELVLDGLEPQPNLRELSIKNFMGEQFPPWLGNLSMLVRLDLVNCESCTQLPVLGHLPCLGYLRFLGLKKLSCVGASFYWPHDGIGGSGVKPFPTLKTFILENMPNLTEWKEANREEVVVDGDAVFLVLENLTIRDCPQLMTTPTHFVSLKNLELRSCSNVTRLWGFGTSLQELRLIDCDNLMGLPENLYQLQSLHSFKIIRCSKILQLGLPPPTRIENHHLKSLQDFEIHQCNALTSIATEILDCCASLKCLWVYECPNLVSFPLDFQQTPSLSSIWLNNCPKLFTNNDNMPRGFGHLTNLRSLRIGPFTDDSSVKLFDWSGLISCSSKLRGLQLCGLGDLESRLPNQFQHLSSLTELFLVDFGLLEVLPDWLGSLMSLEVLGLWNCEKLQCLPSAPAMSRLTKLKFVRVHRCPRLKESLGREKGPDSEWSKISHIRLVI